MRHVCATCILIYKRHTELAQYNHVVQDGLMIQDPLSGAVTVQVTKRRLPGYHGFFFNNATAPSLITKIVDTDN